MAQKVKIILIDDLDGGSADETVRFSLDGSHYEIDLSSSNAAELRESLARYVDVARKDSSGKAPRARYGSGPQRNMETARIREWAKANGYTVSTRGRIQAHIQEAYHQANS
ncbi:histone-like nucleoid-structuring protein Lsr2 [Pseudarthrobacter sp. J1738]|uniref:histone-like nucleoid-structuring protein Lsr2 n=1 Tax=unclassified Pseudarthrobacter TaxID=2647000 RepID=UPI003D2DD850